VPTKPIPVIQAPTTKVVVRAKLKAFGKEWRLVRPNQIIANATFGDGERIDIGELNTYFMGHVHPDERAAFLAAAKDDPSVDMEVLMDLMRQMNEAVYADLADSAEAADGE
jgi:hypothetical protein